MLLKDTTLSYMEIEAKQRKAPDWKDHQVSFIDLDSKENPGKVAKECSTPNKEKDWTGYFHLDDIWIEKRSGK